MEDLKFIEGLDSLLVKVADALGVGLDMVQANGMEYIMEYGKYMFWSKFGFAFIFSALVSILIAMIPAVIIANNTSSYEEFTKKEITIIILGFVIPLILFMVISSLPYIMAPEMYSIKQAIELLK